MFCNCKGLWLHFARVERCWSAHGVQRVGSANSQTRATLTTPVSLVELIVLNVGLQARILDQRIFSMFVLQALVLTFVTTPLTILIYPPRYRVHAGTALEKAHISGTGGAATSSEEFIRSKFAVVLDGMEQLASAMTLTQLLQPLSARLNLAENTFSEKAPQPESSVVPHHPNKCTISVDALRLLELTERTSAVLRSQSADTLIRIDPVLSVFRTFGRLNHFSMSAFLSVISHDEFSVQVIEHVRERGSQLVILPWTLASHVADASTSHHTGLHGPFDSLFSKTSGNDETASLLRSQFVRSVFATSPSDVALFIDRGLSTESGSTIYPHVFLPFFGGPDDRLALSFVIQLCMHGAISATVVRIRQLESDGKESLASVGDKSAPNGDVSFLSKTYGPVADARGRVLLSLTRCTPSWERKLACNRTPLIIFYGTESRLRAHPLVLKFVQPCRAFPSKTNRLPGLFIECWNWVAAKPLGRPSHFWWLRDARDGWLLSLISANSTG